MTTTVLPLDADSGAPAYSAQATRQAFSAFLGVAPSGRPLGAASGVRPGTPSNIVTRSGSGSSWTWACAAHAGVIDAQSSAVAGPYLYATDGTDTGAITVPDATNPRVDIIYVQVNDDVQDGSGVESGTVGYLAGNPASSPHAPGTPPRSLVIANIAVPVLGGGNPTVTWVAPTWGAVDWTSYTPALTNMTIGNGTVTGSYLYDAQTNMVDVIVSLTVGSTTSASGTMQFSVPYTPDTSGVPNGVATSNQSPILVGIAVFNSGRIQIQGTTTAGSWAAAALPPAGNSIAIAVRYKAA